MSKKLLQAAAGNAAGEALYVEDVFSTYLYEGLTNWNFQQEITTSAKTDNHFVILGIVGNNLGSGNNVGSVENNISNNDISLKTNLGGGSADGTNIKSLVSLHYSSSSSGEYIGRTLDAVDSTGEYFGYAATFNYGDATGVTKVNHYINFDFTSSGSDIQSGDLLLFISMDSASATQSTLPSGFTEIFYNNQSGTYGFAIRAAAKIADGTENGTDYGDSALLSASSFEQGIILRKTGGSWDISEMVSSLAEETNTLKSGSKIINGIDLDGEGGVVWIKSRTSAEPPEWMDTEQGAGYRMLTSATNPSQADADGLTSFNSDGFSLGADTGVNGSGLDLASWTFRKAEKFFDVVTYTGNGTTQEISHNLGSVPACIIVKNTQSATYWAVYHESVSDYVGFLNATNAFDTSNTQNFGNNTNPVAPTDSVFTVGQQSLVNSDGETYVAYLFASDAGGFGDDGSESIIKCGSYTTSATSDSPIISLGYEPQLVLVKLTNTAGDWRLFDNMRGVATGGVDGLLRPNLSAAELSVSDYITFNSTGFQQSPNIDSGANTYIYIAIRRPMKTPESGTEVFAVDSWSSGEPNWTSSFPVDFGMVKSTVSSAWYQLDRLRGEKGLKSNSTAAETSETWTAFDNQDGFGNLGADSTYYSWMFKRATGFFDVVAYTGDGLDGRTVDHNLKAVPELLIVKSRSSGYTWRVLYYDGATGLRLNLNDTSAATTATGSIWGDSSTFIAPTSTQFTVSNYSNVNLNNATFIAYLFASVAGVSKVGSYTGTGSNVDVNCGFSAGARFILIKRTDSTGDWYVWDSERGIVAGNDPYLLLNSTAAEVTSTDYIDPLSSGFTVTSSAPAALNASGGTYIYLSIA